MACAESFEAPFNLDELKDMLESRFGLDLHIKILSSILKTFGNYSYK